MTLPKFFRNSLRLLFITCAGYAEAQVPSGYISTDQITGLALNANDRSAVVLIHGWTNAALQNAPSNAFGTASWRQLVSALSTRLIGTGTKLLLYHWEADASTGIALDVSSWFGTGFYNASIAASNGFLNGTRLANLLNQSAPDLRKITFIAHSAGAWAAYRALDQLLLQNPYVVADLVLLDPFIPSVDAATSGVLTTARITQLASQPYADRIYRLENYYAIDLTDLNSVPANNCCPNATSQIFAWRTIDINQRVDYVPNQIVHLGNYYGDPDGHAGPIRFYADTVTATTPGSTVPDGLAQAPWDFTSVGFYRALAYEGSLPHITAQPQAPAQPVQPGQAVTLTVSAVRADSFQWFKDGQSISGASSTLNINSVSANDAGAYVVRLTNSVGEVFSDKAVLQVGPVSQGLLAAPTLTSPANAAASVSTAPIFAWTPVYGASSYRILIATDPAALTSDPQVGACAGCIVDDISSTASYTRNTPLQGGNTYYWQVHGRNSSQYGTWSSRFSFTTSAPASCGNGSSVGYTPGGATPVHPIGTFVLASGDSTGTVFLIQGPDSHSTSIHRDGIANLATLQNPYNQSSTGNQFDVSNIITISVAEMNSYPAGGTYSTPRSIAGDGMPLPAGTLIQAGNAEISIVQTNGTRRPFQLSTVFLGLGFLYCNVVQVSSSSYNSYTVGSVVDGLSNTNSTLAAPSLVVPADGSTGVSPGTALTWNPVNVSAGYTVYIGTTNPPPVATITGATSYSPSLSSGTTYYWTVASRDPNNNNAESKAAVRSFTTAGITGAITINVNGGRYSPRFTQGQPAGYIALQLQNSSGAQMAGTVVSATQSGGNWLTLGGPTVTSISWFAPQGVAVGFDPTGLASGTYNGSITITSPQASNSPVIIPVDMVIYPPLVITTPATLPDAIAGQTYNVTLQATGGTGLNWTIQNGSLPASLSLNSSTGVISGTVGQSPGSAPLNISVQDSAGRLVFQTFTINWREGVIVSSFSADPVWAVGSLVQYFPYDLRVSGGTAPYQWSAVGLPMGVNISSAGALSGAPTTAGSYPTVFTATDAVGLSGSLSVTVKVIQYPIQIYGPSTATPPSLPSGVTGSSYGPYYVTAGGGTQNGYQWTVAGSLPPGITAVPNTNCTQCALIFSGTPTKAGIFPLTLSVTDSANNSVSSYVALLINQPGSAPTITQGALPLATIGNNYSYSYAATGGTGALTWKILGPLPDPSLSLSATGGLTANPTIPNDCSSGPRAFSPPQYSPYKAFFVQVTDTAGQSDVQQSCLPAYYPQPAIASISPPDVVPTGSPITLTVQGSGFQPSSQLLLYNNAVQTTFVSNTTLQFSLLPSKNSLFQTVGGLNLGPDPAATLKIGAPYTFNSSNATFAISLPRLAINGVQGNIYNTSRPCYAGYSCVFNVTGSGFTFYTNFQVVGNSQYMSYLGTTSAVLPWTQVTTSSVTLPAGTYTLLLTNPNQPDGSIASASATFTVYPNATIVPNPSSFNPKFTQGDAPSSASMAIGEVEGIGGTAVVSGGSWLKVNHVSSYSWLAPETVTVSFDPTGLPPATYNGSITLSSNCGGCPNTPPNPPVVVPVTMLVSAPSAPSLSSLSPNSATAGGPAVSLTANGSGFVLGSTVQWNGASLPTTFVSAAQLTASVTASLIASAGSATVTVLNPGSLVSNTATFTVRSGSGPPIQPVAAFLDRNGAPALTFDNSMSFPDAGGYLIGAPGITQAPNGDVYIVGLDGAGGVHLNSYSYISSAWNGWQYSGGILDTTSGLTAAVAPNGVVWFTGRDIGNRFWINSWNGSSFGGWILLDQGIFAHDSIPQIAITADGSVYVIGKDIGGRIWSNSYIPSSQTFTGWIDRQAIMIGQPSVTAGQDGFVYVAVRSVMSGSPVYITQIPANNGPPANTWLNGGGLINSDPSITSVGGTVYLTALAGGGTVYLLTFSETNQTYGSWSFTNGILNDETIATQAGNLYIAGRDSGNRIYWYSVTGSNWFFAGGGGISSTALRGAK